MTTTTPIPPDDAQIRAALRRHFNYGTFREGQLEAIRESLAGEDVMVIMPTGSGKSICFQLTAMLLPGVTLVVSPLIALMKDQVDSLVARGLPATFLNSSLQPVEMFRRMREIEAGRHKIVYVAPERFRSPRFLETISHVDVSLFTVDEAHCISQWGHDFRPDYLQLRNIAARLGGTRIMAVTATATPDVRKDIALQLGLGEAPRREPRIHVHGFARPNLHISVVRCPTHEVKLAQVAALVRRGGAGIVYCATRKQAERTYSMLAARVRSGAIRSAQCVTPTVLLYHGAMGDRERAEAHSKFVGAPCPVVVATNAFGMGMDRADLRFVAHWDMPGSIEAYYQEIGRAGRDGKPSRCVLLYNYADVRTQEFFIDAANPTRAQTMALLSAVRSACASAPRAYTGEEWADIAGLENDMVVRTVFGQLERAGLVRRSRVAGSRTPLAEYTGGGAAADMAALKDELAQAEVKSHRDHERLQAMLYFVGSKRCLHEYILHYFGEVPRGVDFCGGCDHCGERKAPAILSEEQWIVVQKVLSCVARMDGRHGADRVIQVLRADADPRLAEYGLDRLSTWGLLRDRTPEFLEELIDRLKKVGCIEERPGRNAPVAITRRGVRVAQRRPEEANFTVPWPQ